ncbi:MAG: thiol reductant ABC exporter subunit CydC [Rhodospirillales bacterium 20-64-7]|nr:MAG: thiol reductant ABC exporter subunit CydC [Rhodospirillales bacterium 20-64-7]
MGWVSRLRGLFAPYRGWMWAGVALSCVTVLANFWLLTLSGWFLAATAIAGLAGYAAQNAFNFFTPAAFVRFFATIRVGARYAERLVTHEATLRLLAELRVWFYARIEPLAPAALQGVRSADLLSRIVGDIDALNLFYLRVYVPVITALITGVIMAGFFAWFSLGAALALAAGLALAGAGLPWLTHRLGRPMAAALPGLQARQRADYVDAMQGMGELLTYGAGPALAARAKALDTEIAVLQARLARVSGLSLAGTLLATCLTLLLVVLAGAAAVAGARLAPADLPLLALGTLGAFEAVAPLPLAFQQLGQASAAARRIFALADAAPAVTPPTAPASPPQGFALELDDVSLRYAPEAGWALHRLSLRIPEGRRVGIIGPTGSGKSTLINLLLRFNEFQEGEARFGGQDLRCYSGAELARLITVISQRSHIFQTSIRDNLLLADGRASEEAMWRALAIAQLDSFVRAQPRGLDTQAGEGGARLSGGQARRLALARAALRPTPWLILDEPTEGLDGTTEQEFLRDLAPLLEQRTVLYITHRPAGLALMHEVHALDAGELRR